MRARNDHARERFFRSASTGIIILAGIGVVFTFILGSGSEGTTVTTTASTGSSPSIDSSGGVLLSEVQYRGRVGQACSDAMKKGKRLSELHARKTVLGAAIDIEQDELDRISELRPPGKLRDLHQDMVSIWQRRISLLESVYDRLSGMSEAELGIQLLAADDLAEQLAQLFRSLGLPECIM
jgi:hypothetical protein